MLARQFAARIKWEFAVVIAPRSLVRLELIVGNTGKGQTQTNCKAVFIRLIPSHVGILFRDLDAVRFHRPAMCSS
jgi:hypothetical protein